MIFHRPSALNMNGYETATVTPPRGFGKSQPVSLRITQASTRPSGTEDSLVFCRFYAPFSGD